MDKGIWWKWLFWGVACLLGFSFIAMSWMGYPLAETDSQWFLPPAISLKRGDGLINRIHSDSFRFDARHQRRLVWYTPGFPLVLATFMWEPSAKSAFVIISAMNAASLLFLAWLLKRIFTYGGKPFGRWAFLWSTLGLLASSTYLVNARIGRPDYLATLIVMGMVYVTLASKNRWVRAFLNSFLLAWLAFTHPVAALFAGVALGLAYIMLSFEKVFLKLSLIAVISISLFFTFMYFFCPFGIVDNIQGILLHARITMRDELICPSFTKFWLVHTYATGYGLLFMGAMAIMFAAIVKYPLCNIRKTFAVIFIGILFFLTARFVAISWDRTYNLWVFSPILTAIFLAPIAKGWIAVAWRKFAYPLIAALLIIFSIGYIQTVLIFPYYLKSAKTYEVAKAEMKEFYRVHPGDIAVSKSLWPLVDPADYNRTITLSPNRVFAPTATLSADWIIFQERYYFYKTPHEVPGHLLLYHDFDPRPLKLFGLIQLIPTAPGYHWAVYMQTAPPLNGNSP